MAGRMTLSWLMHCFRQMFDTFSASNVVLWSSIHSLIQHSQRLVSSLVGMGRGKGQREEFSVTVIEPRQGYQFIVDCPVETLHCTVCNNLYEGM